MVQTGDIGVHVIQIICIWRVQHQIPCLREWVFSMNTFFRFRFIIHGIESNDMLKKDVKMRMRRWIHCDFKERLENIADKFFKIFNLIFFTINVVQAWDLDKPTNVIRKQTMVTDPSGQFIPFLR